MTEIELDGTKYISSKQAAEITNYSKDYVGQLARSGKIDARLVGRSWYVQQESLIGYLEGKDAHVKYSHKKEMSESVTNEKKLLPLTEKIDAPEKHPITDDKPENYIDPGRSKVSDFQSEEKEFDNNTRSIIDEPDIDKKETERKSVGSSGWRSLWGVPAYESDSSDLIPITNKQSHTYVADEDSDYSTTVPNEIKYIEEQNSNEYADRAEVETSVYVKSDSRFIGIKNEVALKREPVRVTMTKNTAQATSKPENIHESNSPYVMKYWPLIMATVLVTSVILIVGYMVITKSNGGLASKESSSNASWITYELHYKR